MQSTYKIPDTAAQLRALSPAEWVALKNHVAHEARIARAAMLRAIVTQALATIRRGGHATKTTVASWFATSHARRPQPDHL